MFKFDSRMEIEKDAINWLNNDLLDLVIEDLTMTNNLIDVIVIY